MCLCSLNIFRGGIHTGDCAAKPRKGFTQQSSATTYIKHSFAHQRMTRLTIATKMRIDRGPDET
jgi:hypothetical protein